MTKKPPRAGRNPFDRSRPSGPPSEGKPRAGGRKNDSRPNSATSRTDQNRTDQNRTNPRGADRGRSEGRRGGPRSAGGRDEGGANESSRSAPSRERSSGARRPAGPSDEPGIKNPYVRFRPLKKPPVALHPTTLWDYPSQHYGRTEQGSQNYRGATPSHVIWNLVQRLTKESDLVVDPFCGSGTTLDVCRDLGRRSRGVDLAPTRPEIVRADARQLSTVVDRETAHLVFFDPPYADNLTYSDDPRCIGKLAFEDGTWSRAMGEVMDEVKKVLKPGAYAAGFVSDVLHVEKKSRKEGGRTHQSIERTFGGLGFELVRLALARGFSWVDHIAVVRHGRALDDPRLKARAQNEGFLLRGFSHLVVFQKPMTSSMSTRAH
jgi:adenine-specific DNA-methyltransferase